jgi:GT2 family glycosyltransferase
MKKSISVVIPNYNGRGLLEKNLPFLFTALQTSGCDFEVIISDDHSSDDSVSFLKTTYPSIILIENHVNLGFSGNINKGIARASKELVFLLNSDIELTQDYFKPLFQYFEDDKTFGVMGRIIALNNDVIQDGAKYPKYKGGTLTSTLNYLPFGTSKSFLPSLFLSGANALVDRKKLLALGSFQELFNPFYWEDVELGVKAWRMGYPCYYEDAAICRHPTSATISKYNKKKKVSLIARRNKILFHYLHLEGFVLFTWLLSFATKALFRCLIFNTRYLQSLVLFLKQYRVASEAKRAFVRKQQQLNPLQPSLKDICDQIKKQIGNTLLRTF